MCVSIRVGVQSQREGSFGKKAPSDVRLSLPNQGEPFKHQIIAW